MMTKIKAGGYEMLNCVAIVPATQYMIHVGIN